MVVLALLVVVALPFSRWIKIYVDRSKDGGGGGAPFLFLSLVKE